METIDLIEVELKRVRDSFKSNSREELVTLNEKMIRKSYQIFKKSYPLVIWSEIDPDDSVVLVVELRQKVFFGGERCFQQGFRLLGGKIFNLTERELWDYD